MPMVWTLKKWLAVERDIYRPSELQSLLVEKAGIQLSLQSISALINGKPNALRVQTIQAICNALDCKLSDFFDIVPDVSTKQRKQKIANSSPTRLYGGQVVRAEEDSIFPSPHRFEKQKKTK
jgi:DNA-binding Xre family transcriptional regulator